MKRLVVRHFRVVRSASSQLSLRKAMVKHPRCRNEQKVLKELEIIFYVILTLVT